MTVIVSVKINDGLVMASDSASTFGNGQTYLNADKIVNLVKGLPIGAMVTGSGSIGSESISTLLRDLRSRLDGSLRHPWTLDRSTYTLQSVCSRVREMLVDEKLQPDGLDASVKMRLCGYSSGRSLPEVWEVPVYLGSPEPILVQGEELSGIRWDGEYEPLNRLLLGISDGLKEALEEHGFDVDAHPDFYSAMSRHGKGLLSLPAMPIQDAIDLARWLVETTINYTRFNVLRQPKTVGGSIEIAAITKHEGFRWIGRRHFYSPGLNPH